MTNFRRALCLTAFMCVVHTVAYAQNDLNNWIFGSRAGANFGLVPYSNIPNLFSYEGSSSISDAAGNYLFSTNGEKVWHRNHGTMLNGTQLAGSITASQTALIVPWPQTDCKKFYVFTVSSTFDPQGAILSYSIVDMNQSGGFGDVVVKNVLLKTGVAEKITAVSDGVGGFRVAAHGCCQTNTVANTEFYVYYIGPGGLNPIPVVSAIGHAHVSGLDINGLSSYPTGWGGVGQMKFSPDGARIGSAVSTKFVEVCDFNKTNGKVTACPTLFNADLGAPHPPFAASTVNGLEFSPPNGRFVYVTTYGEPLVQTAVGQLVQFDLNNVSGGGSIIAASLVSSRDMGQLQLAPDGKIYLARQGAGFLSAIVTPNVLSPPLVPNVKAIPSPGFSFLGLPNMVQGPFSCASTSLCPPNATATTVNGATFCCDPRITTLGQTCCKRLCPAGSTETVINGTTQCCSKEGGELIDSNTSKICCSKP
jgi:hypothetical protein